MERTLTGLSVLLQSQALKRALQPYCVGGPYGRLLDAETERLGDASVQVFETEGLIGTGAAPAVLAYLFHRIEDRLDGRPTLLIVDEGWLALDDEGFTGQLREWLKTLRKKNASVVFATQSLSDIDSSAIAPAIAGLAGVDCRATRTGDGGFCAERIMTRRIAWAFMAAILLAGCNQDAANSVVPPPVALTGDAMGVFCGMSLLEHPGPKGQIITAGRIDPFWFTSVRDTVAFTLMPDQPRDIRAIYVSDMARATSWEDPGATNWVDARKAFFVIESRKQGGMGAAEAVPFGNREAADAFAADNGGRVVTFTQIPAAYVLGSDASGDQSQHDRSDVRLN